MAFNGSGVFSRLYNWATDKSNSIPVTASRFDDEDDGFATGLTNCICKDGQSTTTARIPFASGVSAAAGSTSAAAYAANNDTNTGVYFPAADEVALTAGGTQALDATSTKVTVPVDASVTGDFDVNTSKFTVAATSGNTAVAGTLAVTGNSTLSGTLDVTGDVAVNTSKFTVAGSSGNTAIAGTLAVTGNTTITGTLGVTNNFAVNTSKFTVENASGNTAVAGTLSVTGAATLSSSLSAASVSGTMVATQSDMETGTSTTTVVTPGRQKNHPGHPKAWGFINNDGSVTAGYNISSVSHASTGNYTVLFSTPFSSTNYAVIATPDKNNGNEILVITTRVADTVSLEITSSGSKINANFSIVCFGDQ